jgi:hypothetical protein
MIFKGVDGQILERLVISVLARNWRARNWRARNRRFINKRAQ